ncbi:cell surface A33 antigen-like [Myripristis murdjan]|uniref:cell surface A33 antigen-like n=1 Tax=Myripristis murdjan TaxID=586833 RepID=UPI001176117D|nr:cell surface A33 antigen-like [Myripristis murdjan]
MAIKNIISLLAPNHLLEKQHIICQTIIIFLCTFLFITALPCCSSLQVSVQRREYEVASGDDVTLTCSFVPANPDITMMVLTWEAVQENNNEDPLKTVASYFLNQTPDIAPDYEGRATLTVDVARRESSLTLTKVTELDSRNYQCSVLIHNDDEGTTSATTYLLVLERPSPPICRIQGNAEYWNNISLTCVSEKGSPKPSYAWQSYSVQNVPRQFPPRTTEKDGVLSLFNISMETSGFYICESTNRVGSASCNLTLTVMPYSMNIGATAGIIAGVLAGIVCLGIVIYCCCRKKDQKDKYAEGAPAEMEFHDQTSPETGKQYFDDKSSSQTRPRVEQNQFEETSIRHQDSYTETSAVPKFDDDQHSYVSGKESSKADNRHYQDDHHDRHSGSRDRLDDQSDHHGSSRGRYDGSRDHPDDRRDRYGGSRDRLDDQRDRYGGSRDRLDDQKDRHGGSRDRLDDQRDRYGGSRDRLDDQRDRYSGSRDRYGGSRDRLDDQRDRYGGSRDRLDDQRDRYGGSRDRLDDRRDRYGGSRDRLDHSDARFDESQYD